MVTVLIITMLLHFTGSGVCSVIQNPPDLIKYQDEFAEIKCSHTVQSYDRILWYKHRQDSGFTLLGYIFADTSKREPEFEAKIGLSGNGRNDGSLTINNLTVSDSAVYFCAARTGFNANPAYFGAGTKLTVLDKDINITSPTVKVLNVSQNAMCTKKNVTLVCLAEKFYPDHVTVSWTVGGEKRTTDVGTDEAATQGEDKFYTISSRLNIEYKEWTKGQEFTCIVSFFNGSSTTEYEQSITSAKVDDNEYGPEQYMRSGNMTRLAYGIFIVKSFVYGLFVMYIVKRQGLFSK